MQQPPQNNNNANAGQVVCDYVTRGNRTGVPAVQTFTFPDFDTASRWTAELTMLKAAAKKCNHNPSD